MPKLTHGHLARTSGRVAGYALLVVAFSIVAITTLLPRIMDAKALTVLTGSMEPSIPAGSLVLVVPAPPSSVGVGDVITYRASPTEEVYVTHRVVDVKRTVSGDGDPELTFITQGDANSRPDHDPVTSETLRGRVRLTVPHLGAIRDLLATPWALGVLVVGALGVLAVDRLRPLLARRREPSDVVPTFTSNAVGPILTTPLASAPSDDADLEVQLLLCRVRADRYERHVVRETMELIGGQIMAVRPDEVVISFTGAPAQVDRALQLLADFGVLASARSEHLTLPSLEPTHEGPRPDDETRPSPSSPTLTPWRP